MGSSNHGGAREGAGRPTRKLECFVAHTDRPGPAKVERIGDQEVTRRSLTRLYVGMDGNGVPCLTDKLEYAAIFMRERDADRFARCVCATGMNDQHGAWDDADFGVTPVNWRM